MSWLSRAEAAAMTKDERTDYLVRTVIGEAVGEGEVGMAVVAQVIANRAADGRFPADPVAVAGQKFQFSTNNPFGYQGGNSDMVNTYGPNTLEYQQARQAVQAAIYDKSLPDITGGSVFYHTSAMGWPSSWSTSIKQNGFIDIGGHRLYPARPIEPGVIPANLAKVREFGVGSMLAVSQGPAPIRPATLSANLRLQRETNRVAQQRADAPATIRKARALAFTATTDAFDVPRASNANLIINRPEPAMKASMQRQLRATGTPQSTARTFAFDQAAARGLDGDGVLRVSNAMGAKPAAVAAAPWGVRQSVAAVVAATDAAAGRGQLVISGNPNVAGAVVDWLYPNVDGQGEANQDGKGDRARAPSVTIQRNEQAIERAGTVQPLRTPASQSNASADANVQAQVAEQRQTPRVVITNGRAAVTTAPANTNAIVQSDMQRVAAATEPTVAVSLAANIAAKQVRDRKAAEAAAVTATRNVTTQASEQRVERSIVKAPVRTPVSQSTATADRNVQSQASEQAAQRKAAAVPTLAAPTIPGPSAAPKANDRLTGAATRPLEFVPTKRSPANAVGTMPVFSDLAAIGGTASALQIQSGKTRATPGQSIIERSPAKTATTPPLPGKTAPTPAGASARDAARATPTITPPSQATVKASGQPRVTVGPAPVVRSAVRAVVAPLPRPAPIAAPAAPVDPVAAAQAAVNQSGDTSTGNQLEAAQAIASGNAWREAQKNK